MLIIRLFLEKQKLTQNFYEIFKVQKLWEGHKILKKSPVGDFSNFKAK